MLRKVAQHPNLARVKTTCAQTLPRSQTAWERGYTDLQL